MAMAARALKNSWKALLFTLSVWLIFLLVYQPFAEETMKGFFLREDNFLGRVAYAQDVHMIDGTVISQTFTVPGDADTLSFQVTTYERENDNMLNVQLFDADRNMLADAQYATAQFEDYAYIDVPLAQGLKNGRQYTLVLTAVGGDEDHSPAVWLMERINAAAAPVVVDGESYQMAVQIKGRRQVPAAARAYTVYFVYLFIASLVLSVLVKKADEKAFLLYALLVGWGYVLLGQFPYVLDELTHYTKAFSIAQGKVQELISDNQTGNYLPENYGPTIRLKELFFGTRQLPYSAELKWFSSPYVANTPPINHIILAAPLAVCSAAGLPVTASIYAGRAWNYLLYVAICHAAIRRAGRYKAVFFTVAMFPVAQKMASVYSTDPMINGGMLLFASIVVSYGSGGKQQKIGRWDAALLVLCSVLFSGVKYLGYAPGLLLLVVLRREHWRNDGSPKRFLLALILVLGALIVWQIGLLKQFPYKEDRNGDTDTIRQLEHILRHPISFLRVAADFFVNHLLNFRMTRQAEKVLCPLASWFNVLTVLFAAMMVDHHGEDAGCRKKLKIVGVTLFVMISLVNITALYLSFTPVGMPSVAGVQPRYLVPQMIFLMLGVSNWLPSVDSKGISRAVALMVVWLALLGIIGETMSAFV